MPFVVVVFELIRVMQVHLNKISQSHEIAKNYKLGVFVTLRDYFFYINPISNFYMIYPDCHPERSRRLMMQKGFDFAQPDNLQ